MKVADEMYARGKMWVPRTELYEAHLEIRKQAHLAFQTERAFKLVAEMAATQIHSCAINKLTPEAQLTRDRLIEICSPTKVTLVKKEPDPPVESRRQEVEGK